MHISAVERAALYGLNEGKKVAFEIVANRKTGKSSRRICTQSDCQSKSLKIRVWSSGAGLSLERLLVADRRMRRSHCRSDGIIGERVDSVRD